MTVPTVSTLSSGTENSGKLLNSNGNTENNDGGLSFNATMNETASKFDFDDQRYLLPDGQEITAEQLLELLKNGNVLPAMNLPSLSELQHYQFQESLNTPKFIPVINTVDNKQAFQFDTSNKLLNDKFVLNQQQLLNQQINQSPILKSGAVIPEQFLVSLNATNTASNTDMPATGFTAAYGYQLASGPEGATGLMSNSFSIATPVQHPQWNQSLGQSVQWMVNQNIQQAEIKLNPPDLGMLDIRITVNHDQATVHFAAPNSAVRDALESAMPRLRDMLEESGISLADVNVSDHSQQHAQAEQESDLAAGAQSGTQEDDVNASVVNGNSNNSRQMKIGLLDIYA